MLKNLLSKVGWGDLPSSFGYTIGEKVDLPFQSLWELHKGQKRSDASAVSVFICNKKELDSSQVAAARNAEQMAKSLRHPNVLRALDSVDGEGALYLVTEAVSPLLAEELPEGNAGEAEVWGLYQAIDALNFLHTSGFAHGLFGPASIFITSRGDYRLGGFELCRRGADSGGSQSAHKRLGAAIPGWPELPSSCSGLAADLWGVALLMAYVFGTARSQSRGVDFRLDFSRASQDVPPELRKSFAVLQNSSNASSKKAVAELLNIPYFEQHPAIRVMSFLSSLHIRSTEEKDTFFEGLPTLLDRVPRMMQTRQILPELLAAQKFPGQEAAQLLPSILKIGTQLKDDQFKETVAPLVAQLFASPDRAVRFRLLTSLGDMIDHLDDSMINDKIFPECVNGFTDSNGPIREATVKSLIFFIPRLKVKTVEGRVVKLLLKLVQDPEASIRTNSVICCGRIITHLPKPAGSQTLMAALSAGLKDPFGPCRSASLNTLSATMSMFTPEELVSRLLPLVCQRLLDPDCAVSDTAFSVLGVLQQHIRQQVEERRALNSENGARSDQPSSTGETATAQQGGWSSWAFSTVGSVVSQKIMGSMGPSRPSVDSSTQPATPNHSSSLEATPSFGEQASASKPAAPSTPIRSMELSSKRESQASSIREDPVVDGGSGGGAWDDNFWDDFGGIDDDIKVSSLSNSSTTQKPVTSSTAGMRLERQRDQSTKLPGTKSTQAPPKAQAKPKPQAQVLNGDGDDDDFWKEFDM